MATINKSLLHTRRSRVCVCIVPEARVHALDRVNFPQTQRAKTRLLSSRCSRAKRSTPTSIAAGP